MNTERTIVLSIEGMTCGGCARHVTAAIRGVDGTRAVAIDLAARRARVTTEGALPPEALRDALARAGYPAEIATLPAT
ncbi:MAG: heavy metal-associated domain-containing protein [Polyangiales bacterium]